MFVVFHLIGSRENNFVFIFLFESSDEQLVAGQLREEEEEEEPQVKETTEPVHQSKSP